MKRLPILFFVLPLLIVEANAQTSSYSANTVPVGGAYSTAFGVSALHSNTGAGNTATGYTALYSNTSGSSNTATGRASMFLNTTGTGNTANGYYALFANTTGGSNTGSGYSALYSNSTGYYNSALGYQALYTNSSGNSNVACGYQTLYNNTTSGNIAIGYQALFTNTSGASSTAVGYQALYNNTTGNGNTANGYWALYYNSTGFANVASGPGALYRNTTGGGNVANGAQALYSNIDGSYNVASGFNALYYNTSGYANEAYGQGALYVNTTGSYNVATGNYTLDRNTTGSYNVTIGTSSLTGNITGTYNSCVGSSADVASGSLSNATALGSGAIVDASNKVRIGNTSITSIGGQVGWTIYSDARVKNNLKEDVPGLSFISLLKPVTYNYNVAKENRLLGIKNDSLSWPGNKDIEKMKFSGFVAQEVDMAAQKIGYDFSGVDKTGNIMGLRYADFVVPLVKAVQEQQQEIEELKKIIASGPVTGSTLELSDKDAVALHQNMPNPFTKQTIISYRVPVNANSAQLVFYDAGGRLITTHNITERGSGILTVSASDLSSGVYSYTLVVNGKMEGTKQLIKQ